MTILMKIASDERYKSSKYAPYWEDLNYYNAIAQPFLNSSGNFGSLTFGKQ